MLKIAYVTWNIGIKVVGVEGVEPVEELCPPGRVRGEAPGPDQTVQEGLPVVVYLYIPFGLLKLFSY